MATTPSYAGDPNSFDLSTFTGSLTGSCLCGSITVTVKDKPNLFNERNGHLCHCTNCRKISGAAASNNIVIEQRHVDVEDPQGLLRTYEDRATGSGKVTPRRFCGRCSSPIYSLPTDDADQYYVVPLGMFPRMPTPEFELFYEHRHGWEGVIEGTRKYRYMSASGEVGS